MTAFDGSGPIAPSSDYVSFDSINRILTFAPTRMDQIGSKKINIIASDGVLSSDYFFYVLCKTLPQFKTPLTDQTVSIGYSTVYTLPGTIDPDQ